MKLLTTVIALFCFQFAISQAFYGKGDVKFQVGANFQNNATGIMASADFGLGDNISIGIASGYLLGVDKIRDIDGKKVPVAEFGDRIDLKGRFNAHLGNVINVDTRFDVYPGLNVGLKNFGAHLGMRYFFTHGFGLFTELNIPISKYNQDDLTPAEKLNNQVSVNAGLSFNI